MILDNKIRKIFLERFDTIPDIILSVPKCINVFGNYYGLSSKIINSIAIVSNLSKTFIAICRTNSKGLIFSFNNNDKIYQSRDKNQYNNIMRLVNDFLIDFHYEDKYLENCGYKILFFDTNNSSLVFSEINNKEYFLQYTILFLLAFKELNKITSNCIINIACSIYSEIKELNLLSKDYYHNLFQEAIDLMNYTIINNFGILEYNNADIKLVENYKDFFDDNNLYIIEISPRENSSLYNNYINDKLHIINNRIIISELIDFENKNSVDFYDSIKCNNFNKFLNCINKSNVMLDDKLFENKYLELHYILEISRILPEFLCSKIVISNFEMVSTIHFIRSKNLEQFVNRVATAFKIYNGEYPIIDMYN